MEGTTTIMRCQYGKENENDNVLAATTANVKPTTATTNIHKKKAVTIDDILNDSTRSHTQQQQQQNPQRVFSLPNVGAPPHQCAPLHQRVEMLDHEPAFSCTKSIMIHGIEEPRGVISALKTLSKRDVMDALQFSSTHRLFQHCYSGDENTCIAKALVGATSLYAFPLPGIEQQEQQQKTTMCEALCSAYDACRSKVFTFDDQDDPTRFEFYVYADAYTAVFQQSEKDGMVAMVSRSTPGLRRLLNVYGIAHEMCSGKNTRVVFRGEQSAHGLFDILLNHTISDGIKRIVAPVAFQNASLLKTPFRVSSKSTRADVVLSVSVVDDDRYNTTISSIPPWVVSRLTYLLSCCCGGGGCGGGGPSSLTASSYTISTTTTRYY